MKVLVLGDGKLGSEIVKQTGWDFISRKKDKFDITNSDFYAYYLLGNSNGMVFWQEYDVIVNCIANTNTYSIDKEPMYKTNYEAVRHLSDFCNNHNIKLVHISTDYVYAGSSENACEDTMPVPLPTWYTYYKLMADEYIAVSNPNFLICRCSFKSTPFQYDNAWIDLTGNFDYVDVIAGLIIKLIEKNAKGIYNVGTELKTMYDLARKTHPEVKPSFRPSSAPSNISININKMKSFLNEN